MRRLLVGVLVAVALPTVAGCGASGPKAAAQKYLEAWSKNDLNKASALTSDPTQAMQTLTRFRTDLHVNSVNAKLGVVATHGSDADAEYDATVQLQSTLFWRYVAHLQLHKAGSSWLVRWTPQDIHPMYSEGSRLLLQRTLPPRASMVDRNGTPLFTPQPVVKVGLEKQRLGTQASSTISAVARILHVQASPLTAAVAKASPTAFVPVITLRLAAYEKVKPRIYPLPGTVFVNAMQLLPPATGFARPLLGSVGEATADVVKQGHGRYSAGDVVGLSGLQLAYQDRLTGTATTSIVVRGLDGSTVATLKTFPGHAGAPVRTTLDVAVQRAAEQALAHEPKNAALVAVDARTGDILAAASTPDATSYDRALSGRYPPGSTFKLVTTYALLAAGVTPTTTVPCPRTVTVDGKVFQNFEGEATSSATFADDFAHSCNTAFISAAKRLPPSALPRAASAMGLGAPWHLPLDAFSGAVPAPGDAVEQAASAIGQAKVEVSPLEMALVAAAIDTGTPHAPVLVTEPAQKTSAALPALDPARLAALRALMRRVVTNGTAAGAHLPAATFGKTGTAEFGSDNPPKTHAWFVGYRGRIAFAVLVEGGGVGGEVAAPIAAAFLRHVHA